MKGIKILLIRLYIYQSSSMVTGLLSVVLSFSIGEGNLLKSKVKEYFPYAHHKRLKK